MLLLKNVHTRTVVGGNSGLPIHTCIGSPNITGLHQVGESDNICMADDYVINQAVSAVFNQVSSRYVDTTTPRIPDIEKA